MTPKLLLKMTARHPAVLYLEMDAPRYLRRCARAGSEAPGRYSAKSGDVVLAGPLKDEDKKLVDAADQKKAFDLEQVPEVNGAFVALDPHTGRVLAMSGGYSYGGTEFNRATQAKRQPGSSFKPFAYLAGLENGFNPSTISAGCPGVDEPGRRHAGMGAAELS